MNNSVFFKEKQLRVTPMVGTNITDAIQEAIAISKSKDVEVSFDFNGQEVVVDKNSTVESAYKVWVDKKERARIEYEKSPEYAESQRRAKMIRQDAQNNLDRLMDSIDTIDFSNLEQLLPFLSKIISYGDTIGVRYDRKKVIELLKANGYFENMNCDTETHKTDLNDKVAVGQWIVGQYMSCGEYPIISAYIERWEKQFVTPQKEDEQEKPKTM